jgi:hypothetical protein
MGRSCSRYVRGQRRIQGFGGGNLREGDHFEDRSVDGRIILNWIWKKYYVGARPGSISLRTGTGGVLL